MERGKNEFKEMWITDDVVYDLDDMYAFLGDETTVGGLVYALEQARIANTSILLDTTDNGDAPLMAGAFIKHDGNGDPDNQGDERAKATLEAKVDGLQKPIDMVVYKKIIAFKGQRKNCYHIDRRLSVVEIGYDLVIKVNGDGTNNSDFKSIIIGEQIGDLNMTYKRRAIPKTLPTATVGTPDNEVITGGGTPMLVDLDWNDVTGFTTWDVEINGVVHEIEGSQYLIDEAEAGLSPLVITYNWRVRPKNGLLVGPWSKMFTFGLTYTP
jgi:hypothetical protein